MPNEFRLHVDADRVKILLNGRLIADLPWEAALELGRALIHKGHEAEEYAKHQLIIADQALLLRVGATLGLTSNGALQAEAAKEAVHNRALRRYLPGGVKSREQFGTPSIIQHPPRRPQP